MDKLKRPNSQHILNFDHARKVLSCPIGQIVGFSVPPIADVSLLHLAGFVETSVTLNWSAPSSGLDIYWLDSTDPPEAIGNCFQTSC